MAKDNAVQGAQTLDRALNILWLVADRNRSGVRMADVVRLCGLSQPTTHRLVNALTQQGLLERDATSGLYHLGSKTFILGTIASMRHDIKRLAEPTIARIVESTGDTVLLTVRHCWHGVCIMREEGLYPVRSQVTTIGDRQPLGVSAAGLAILSTFRDDEMEEAIAANVPLIESRFANYSEQLIRQMIQLARDEGYALNNGLVYPSSWGIAVPVRGASGECLAAITVAAIEQRFEGARRMEVVKLLQQEIGDLERKIASTAGRMPIE